MAHWTAAGALLFVVLLLIWLTCLFGAVFLARIVRGERERDEAIYRETRGDHQLIRRCTLGAFAGARELPALVEQGPR